VPVEPLCAIYGYLFPQVEAVEAFVGFPRNAWVWIRARLTSSKIGNAVVDPSSSMRGNPVRLSEVELAAVL
jgi:hypothetical protein